MSKEYQDASWTGDETTMNESYLSAEASPGNNTTQYFSILEDTTVQDDSANITVQLGSTLDETATTEMFNDSSALLQEPDRVMLYRIQGSDDMYAVQVAEDENGKLQKYQFKVRPTADDQYEAVQDTITVIPFDASDPIIPQILDESSNNTAHDDTVEQQEELQSQEIHIKCEQLAATSNGSEHLITGTSTDTDYHENVSGAILGEVGTLEMQDEFEYEESGENNAVVDTKEGILHLQSSLDASSQQHKLPSDQELKLEYFRNQDNHNDPSDDDDDNRLQLAISNSKEVHSTTISNDDLRNIEQKVIVHHEEPSEQVYEEADSAEQEQEQEEQVLYSQLNHEDAVGMLADSIEYVGVQEPVYDESIEDESTQLEQEQEQEQEEDDCNQVLGDCETLVSVENDLNTDEGEEGTEYILATGLSDEVIAEDDDGIEYEQIFVTNEDQIKSPIKSYLDASQLQQLTLAAAVSNNNQLPLNAAYIVTKIINENQSITTTATSIDQGVKLVRSLRIKRIGNPAINDINSSSPVPALVTTNNTSSPGNCLAVSRAIEKENVSNVNTNVISNMLKPNPRSILKASHIILRKPEQHLMEHIDKRFARSKELQRKRMFLDYIAQTKILQAPVRQERLPRKQLIKPVQRTDEEIIVREMVISSNGNGFIETLDDKVRENNVTSSALKSYEQLSDSDSDFRPYNTGKRKRKYKKRKQQTSETTQSPEEIESDDSVMSSRLQDAIDLSADSEGEEIIETIIINSTGKRRGRPPKSKVDVSPTKRRGRPPKNRQSSDSAPVPEETICIVASTEHKCTLCSKVFPSVGSLRSHMNFHKYMEEKPETKADDQEKLAATLTSVQDNKYSCSKCSSSFKNAILLTKHIALHDKKDKFECKVCKKVFIDNIQLMGHRKSHIKDHMFQSTQISPQKHPKASTSFKCFVCNKLFSSSVLLEAHMKMHRNVFSCGNCGRNFMSKVLLDNHVRIECVKRRSNDSKKKISFVAKPSLHKLADSSVFAKPNALLHSRRTTLRTMSTTSQDEDTVYVRKTSASRVSQFPSQESIASSSTSSLASSEPASFRTPANRKTNLGRITSSNIKSSGLDLKLKCDECGEVFTTFLTHYKHKVLTHGMPTTDATISVESEKKEKSRIHKPIPGHSGVPANPNLAKAFASLQEKLKHL